jgi:hypothetical protein
VTIPNAGDYTPMNALWNRARASWNFVESKAGGGSGRGHASSSSTLGWGSKDAGSKID